MMSKCISFFTEFSDSNIMLQSILTKRSNKNYLTISTYQNYSARLDPLINGLGGFPSGPALSGGPFHACHSEILRVPGVIQSMIQCCSSRN